MTDFPTKLIRSSAAEFLIFAGQVGEKCSESPEKTKRFCVYGKNGGWNE
jgi:hypothetical protein